jgi:hypothetical protein
VLRPTSEFNDDFLQKQTVIVTGRKVFHCSRPTLLAKETKSSFSPHPQAPEVSMKVPVSLPARVRAQAGAHTQALNSPEK